jgi:hypothetical protein
VLRLAYGLSVLLLAGLAMATLASPVLLPVLRPQAHPATLPVTAKLQLLAGEETWVLQYEVTNDTGEAAAYLFELVLDGVTDHWTAVVKAGDTFSYIYHIAPQRVASQRVRFLVRRASEVEPLDDVTLHLASAGPAAPATSWWTQLRARFASGARQ